MRLYHFTCRDHGYPGIVRDRVIRPNPGGNPFLPTWPPVVWLTDLPSPMRDAVGLTSANLSCDRMEVRFSVEVEDAIPFAEARRRWRIPLEAFLTLTAFGRAEHWYVSPTPIGRDLLLGEAWMGGA